MAIDLKALNAKQLADLIEQAERRKAEVAKQRVGAVKDKVMALLKAEGLAFEQVFGRKGAKRAPVAPKYRNPADPAQTWSGRGKRPRWFAAALKAGKKEKELVIK